MRQRSRVMSFVVEVVETVDEGDEFPITTSEHRAHVLRSVILSAIQGEQPVESSCGISGIYVKGDIW